MKKKIVLFIGVIIIVLFSGCYAETSEERRERQRYQDQQRIEDEVERLMKDYGYLGNGIVESYK